MSLSGVTDTVNKLKSGDVMGILKSAGGSALNMGKN